MLGAVGDEVRACGRWRPGAGWAEGMERALGTATYHRGGPEDVLRAWAGEHGFEVREGLEVVDASWVAPEPRPVRPVAVVRGLFD